MRHAPNCDASGRTPRRLKGALLRWMGALPGTLGRYAPALTRRRRRFNLICARRAAVR
jgi:hypothetical protein